MFACFFSQSFKINGIYSTKLYGIFGDLFCLNVHFKNKENTNEFFLII
jgi:hypothetical protein